MNDVLRAIWTIASCLPVDETLLFVALIVLLDALFPGPRAKPESFDNAW